MMTGPIRFGILGCGMIARFHANAIRATDKALLLGVADASLPAAQEMAREFEVGVYASAEEMLADPQIDAITVCTPSGFHAENVRAALRAGKHCLVEKPLAFTKAEARALAEEARERGLVFTVISQLRFSEDIQRVKRLMEEGAFGDMVFCDLYMKYWRDPSYFAQSPWRGSKRLDGGGALMNQGIHGIDLLLYLAGWPRVLHARTDTHLHNIEVEDRAVAMLEFENGALGVIQASTCSNPGFERRLELIGNRGSAVIVENRIKSLTLDGKTVEGKTHRPRVATASDPAAMSGELHARQIANFTDAVLGLEALHVRAEDGIAAVSLIEEIYRSSCGD